MSTKNNFKKEIQTKLAKGLLDMIILEIVEQQPMHGYQIISRIRKDFGVCFGASTVYPLLSNLEEKGYVNSEWNTNAERPKKVYSLTKEGRTILNFAESSLVFICKNLAANGKSSINTPTY